MTLRRRVRHGARAVVTDIRPLQFSADYRRLWFGRTAAQLGQQMTTIAIAPRRCTPWSASLRSLPRVPSAGRGCSRCWRVCASCTAHPTCACRSSPTRVRWSWRSPARSSRRSRPPSISARSRRSGCCSPHPRLEPCWPSCSPAGSDGSGTTAERSWWRSWSTGLAVGAVGLSDALWFGVFFLAVSGAADMVSAAYRSTMLQSAAPDVMRGRLQGVFTVVVAGGPRAGEFLAGTLAELVGERPALLIGGTAACSAYSWPQVYSEAFSGTTAAIPGPDAIRPPAGGTRRPCPEAGTPREPAARRLSPPPARTGRPARRGRTAPSRS